MRSPVLQAERHYQRRMVGRSRRILRVLGMLIVAAGVLITLELLALELWGALARRDITLLLLGHDALLRVLLNLLPLALLLLAALAHFALLLRALMLSTGAIRRERRQATWDLLVLTNQRAAGIVLAKWGATILTLVPQALVVAALRFGVIIFVGLELFRFDNFYVNRSSVQYFFEVGRLPFLVRPQMFLLGAALILLLTLLNLMLTAAFGVLVSSIRRGGNGGDVVALGFILRSALLGIPALLLIAYNQSRPFPELIFGGTLGFSLLDNGTLVASALLTAPRHYLNFVLISSATQFYPPDVIPPLLGVYALLTAAALAASIFLLRREGV